MRERLWLAPGADVRLGADLGRSVAAWMQAAPPAAALSTDRDSAAVRVAHAGGDLLVKWRRPTRVVRWRNLARASRERREARGLLLARELGLDVPLPLLVGERRSALGFLLGAVLVRPWIDGRESAAALLATPGGERLWAPLLHGVRDWHERGFRHGDAWPRNVLLAPDGSGALPIGASRARRAPAGPRIDRPRLMDLARLVAGARELWPGREPDVLLAPYAEGRDVLPIAGLATTVAPLLASVESRRARDVAARPAREPHGPLLPVPLPPDAARVPQSMATMCQRPSRSARR